MGNVKNIFGDVYRGFVGGFGEGSGLPSLAGRYTRADVSSPWAEVGRQLGQIQGQHFAYSPTGYAIKSFEHFKTTPTYQQLLQLGQRLRQRQRPTPPPHTASSVRRKQGAGWWGADIGEEED